MSAISLKSITGITSITTPAGVDNQLTLHNNNTTEAVKLDTAGNLHFHNHLNIAGVTTVSDNIEVVDNKHVYWGTDKDLSITHNGTHGFLHAINGGFYMKVANGEFLSRNGAQVIAKFLEGTGGVELYYNNSKKFNTTNTGATLTGATSGTTTTFNVTAGSGGSDIFTVGKDGIDTKVVIGGIQNCHTDLFLQSHLTEPNNINFGHSSQPIRGQIKFHTYNNYMSFSTNQSGVGASERLRIDGSGRVLIGHGAASGDLHGPQTTTGRGPYVQLHGTNAANAGAALISWKNQAGSYYAPTLYLAHSGSDTIGTNGILPSGGEFGSIVFSGDDGTDFVKGAMIKARLDGTPGNDDMPGRLEFHTTSDGAQAPVERLRIDSDGQVQIGSGTIHGGGHLTIRGGGVNTYATLDYQYVGTPSNNSTTIAQLRFTANTTGASVVQGAKIQAVSDAAWSATGDAPTRLEFHTTPDGSASMQERLRIFSDGRVQIAGQNAIATTSLTHRLLVRAQNDSNAIAIAGRNGDHIGELSFYQSDASTRMGEIQAHTTHLEVTSRLGYLSLQSNGPTERVRISSNELRFNSTAQQIHLNTSDGSDTGYLNIGAAGGPNNQNRAAQAVFYGNEYSGAQGRLGLLAGNSGNSNGYMYFQTGGSERLRITEAGNIQHLSGTGISYFNGASEYIFGSASSSPNAGGFEANVQIQGSKTRAQFAINAYMNNPGGPMMNFLSSRSGTVGTLGSKVQSNDYIGEIRFSGDNATNYNSVAHGATIWARAKSTPGDGDTSMAGEIHFSTGTSNGGGVHDVALMQSDGKLRYSDPQYGLGHAVQSRTFVLYPNNGGNNKTTIRVSGLVSGCFIFQMGYYNSAGQGEGGFACAVSGYMTAASQYTIDNIKAPYAHANSSISSINKQNSYFEFTITNNHGSYTGGGTIGIIGDQEMTITVTYHQ